MSDAPPTLPSQAADTTPRQAAAWPLWAGAALALVAAGALGLAWTGQQRLERLEAELVKRQQDSQDVAREARLMAKQSQDTARDAAARAALLDSRVSEVSEQRHQIEDLMRSLNRTQDESLVADLDAALRVATQQSALMGSVEPLVSALQSADERLARAQQPRLEGVRRAVAKDLDRIKATRVTDLPGLAIRLDEAIRLIDELPLINEPAQANAAQAPKPNTRQASAAASSRARATPPAVPPSAPGATPEPPASEATAWTQRLLDWGSQAGQVIWREARDLVRVTRISQPEAMLLAPKESYFLRENLKLRLLNARLSLLSRQTGMAQADLLQARASVERYFDTGSRKTQLVLGLIKDIHTQSPLVTVPGADDTLLALSMISGGR